MRPSSAAASSSRSPAFHSSHRPHRSHSSRTPTLPRSHAPTLSRPHALTPPRSHAPTLPRSHAPTLGKKRLGTWAGFVSLPRGGMQPRARGPVVPWSRGPVLLAFNLLLNISVRWQNVSSAGFSTLTSLASCHRTPFIHSAFTALRFHCPISRHRLSALRFPLPLGLTWRDLDFCFSSGSVLCAL